MNLLQEVGRFDGQGLCFQRMLLYAAFMRGGGHMQPCAAAALRLLLWDLWMLDDSCESLQIIPLVQRQHMCRWTVQELSATCHVYTVHALGLWVRCGT